jgi:hypothetical protein
VLLMRRRYSGLSIATTTLVVDDCWIICPVPPMAPIALLISECRPDRLALEIGSTGKVFVVC